MRLEGGLRSHQADGNQHLEDPITTNPPDGEGDTSNGNDSGPSFCIIADWEEEAREEEERDILRVSDLLVSSGGRIIQEQPLAQHIYADHTSRKQTATQEK